MVQEIKKVWYLDSNSSSQYWEECGVRALGRSSQRLVAIAKFMQKTQNNDNTPKL